MNSLRMVLATLFMLASVVAQADPAESDSVTGSKNLIFFARR